MSDMDPYAGPPTEPVRATPAGWYPESGSLRWWDGGAWTEHRQALAAPSPSTYQPAVGWSQPVRAGAVIVTDARPKPVETAIAWILTVLSVGYFLPWAIAATRGKSNSWAVGLVNFLVGWTVIGWVVALVMACTAHGIAALRA